MSGETDITRLLGALDPRPDPREYGFARVAGAPPEGLDWFALIREPGGLTIIAPAARLEEAGIAHTPGWACITLGVHSSLSAVGLTAAVAGALTQGGISANVVAGHDHDHVLVPWARRDEALALLIRLSEG